ncbi:hypothetical protein MTO96_052288 [Rhipicephalus appendiculatus]
MAHNAAPHFLISQSCISRSQYRLRVLTIRWQHQAVHARKFRFCEIAVFKASNPHTKSGRASFCIGAAGVLVFFRRVCELRSRCLCIPDGWSSVFTPALGAPRIAVASGRGSCHHSGPVPIECARPALSNRPESGIAWPRRITRRLGVAWRKFRGADTPWVWSVVGLHV